MNLLNSPRLRLLTSLVCFFISMSLCAQGENSGIVWKSFSSGISTRDENDPLGLARHELYISYEFPVSGLSQDKIRMLTDTLLSYYFGRDFIGMSPQGAVNVQMMILVNSGDYLSHWESNVNGTVDKNINNVYVSVESSGSGMDGSSNDEYVFEGGQYDRKSVILHIKQDLWFANVWDFKSALRSYNITEAQFERWIKESLLFDGHTAEEIDYGKVSVNDCKVAFSKSGWIVTLPYRILRKPVGEEQVSSYRKMPPGAVTTIPWEKLSGK